MIDFTIERDDPVSGTAIEALRLAVGWDEEAGKYDRVPANAWMHLTVRDRGRLIGYVSVVSDGICNAFIADLMVHPGFQRRGIGTAVVRRAVRELHADGVRGVHVTFTPELEPFYRACGFLVIMGGIIDNDLG
ncbi:MAG: GNAT family N-acetyltransferase [Lentisphaeria bacterium]|jgi:ribosomal protein S18 acetylase RimI-like enzyme|nr:GNAT family N-acetyltransferase [Lentisphaeria bacterium]MDP7739938.1 GNAT family N-acetyltransferase [Lentisphaeria bacterium]